MWWLHLNVPLSFVVLPGLAGRSARKSVPCTSAFEGAVYSPGYYLNMAHSLL